MGFPFMFWGGSDHNASAPAAGETEAAPLPTGAGAAGGAAAGAAAGPYYPSPQSEEDASIYGQQQSPSRGEPEIPRQSQWNEDVADEEWGQDIGEEPVMQDPWEQLFGDQGGSSGGGDDWGGGSSEW